MFYLVSATVKSLYKINQFENFSNSELTILPTQSFYPAGANQLDSLWVREKNMTMTEEKWKHFFRDTLIVHFYAFQTRMRRITRNVKTEAYSYLAPHVCPVSYWSSKQF